MACERPGGGYEDMVKGWDDYRRHIPMFRELPRRPNGEIAKIPLSDDPPIQRTQEQEDQRRRTMKNNRIRRAIRQATIEVNERGTVSEELITMMKNYLEDPEFFEAKEEVQAFMDEIPTYQRIYELKEEQERMRVETTMLQRWSNDQRTTLPSEASSSTQWPDPQRPRINTLRVIKVEVEEKEETIRYDAIHKTVPTTHNTIYSNLI